MSERKYWWVINRIKADPVKITEAQAGKVAEQLRNGTEFIAIRKQMIAASNISSVEETTEPILEDNLYLLTSGDEGGAPEAIMDMEGNTVCNWYKKPVSRREYEKHFAGIPAYKVLEADSDGMWIAFRLPEYSNDLSRSRSHLTVCSADEVSKLEHANSR